MEQRGVKKIQQYSTPKMKYPSPQAIADNIERVPHVWKSRDMYWKLAAEYYGDSQLWWVIAWFNQKPTEVQCKNGDLIMIPFPLERLYRYFGL